MKLFFGCSRKDRDFVDILMTYLNRSYDIDLSQMYNCYVGQTSIPVSTYFNDSIKQIIKECDRAIIIISPESLKRKYCLCELGAAWGLDKNITLIIVEPCNVTDLFEMPIMGIQSWYINPRDIHSIEDFIYKIKNDEDFKAIQKTNGTKQLIAENEFRDALYALGYKYSELPPLPEYQKCFPFHANGDPNTLRILTNGIENKEKIKIRIDFTTSKPKFAGICFDLAYADWTGLVANKYGFSFRIDALPTIKGMKVEFKKKIPGQNLYNIGEYYIKLAHNPENVTINLGEINNNPDDWQHLKELVFVFMDSDVEEIGTCTISNFEFVQLS